MAFTFFFRDSHTLQRATDFLLPLTDGQQSVRIWNPGCAMGPETYTFTIILAERMSPQAFKKVRIDATDIDESGGFGNIITEAVYPAGDLSRLPEGILDKYFEKYSEDGKYRVIGTIREKVHFQQHDLLTLQPTGTGYCFIICKNVLLHFSQEQRIEVVKMFHQVLSPNGLFTTEQTQNLPDECSHLFRSLATDAHVYQKIS